MARRFGRNQRRKLREQLQSAERVLEAVKISYHSLFHENAELQARLRRAIEVDCKVFEDNSRANYEARMEAYRMGEDGLYIAQQIDVRELAHQRDRKAFIEECSRRMAVAMARSIGAKWS